ncbi:uncharacterized protein LOC115644340 [Gopherus evgoodei]|uniref:uncharacterized protein LOC115644340 n=1 Tax=Gopherus evgoodei TaxID=1825980 RepID=UPI0011CF2F69|nr:uncharacterized protein LOC115644340 [Gopherus evgoodei]
MGSCSSQLLGLNSWRSQKSQNGGGTPQLPVATGARDLPELPADVGGRSSSSPPPQTPSQCRGRRSTEPSRGIPELQVLTGGGGPQNLKHALQLPHLCRQCGDPAARFPILLGIFLLKVRDRASVNFFFIARDLSMIFDLSMTFTKNIHDKILSLVTNTMRLSLKSDDDALVFALLCAMDRNYSRSSCTWTISFGCKKQSLRGEITSFCRLREAEGGGREKKMG